MPLLKPLEVLNVDICRQAGAGKTVGSSAAAAAYDRIMAKRQAEVRAAIAAARKATGGDFARHYIDGIESALERAIKSPRMESEK